MPTSDSGSSGRPVTLDQFIALNDELAALVRAGVPLEHGLIEAGRDLRGRLGAVSTQLGQRMGEGMRLPEALGASGGGLPDVYRAVVEAGVRSGRLARALEGMALIARGYAEARRAVGMALLYPLMILVLAYALGVAFVILMAPRFVRAFESLGLASVPSLIFLERAGEAAPYWAPILPILLAIAGVQWVRSGRSMNLDVGRLGPFFNRIPMIGAMIGSFRAANFSGLLSLLVEHHVPLDEAVQLAGDASGDREFRAASTRFADSIRRGEGADPQAPSKADDAFPPLLSWMLTAGHRQADLARALAHLATTYRRKATGRAETLKLALPAACVLVIGVGAVMVYALLLFVPLIQLWDELALPNNG